MVSVIYSHQTAGPAFKLEKSIKRIIEGDLTFQVSLRRNDNLKELAAALNELLDKFRTTLSKTKSLTEDINNKLGSVKDDKSKNMTRNPNIIDMKREQNWSRRNKNDV